MNSAQRAPKHEIELLQLFVIEEGLSEANALQKYLRRFLKQVARWFEAQGASFFLADRSSTHFPLAGQTGTLSTIPENTVLKRGEGIAGKAIVSGRPELIQGRLGQDSQRKVGSSMVLPLHDGRSKCVGVLNLARSVGQKPFDESDLALAETLGHQLAMAIANARLIHESLHVTDILKVVFSNLGFGVLSVDEDGCIGHYNPEFVMMTGRVPGEAEPLAEYLFRCDSDLTEPLQIAGSEALSGKRHRRRLQLNGRVLSISATPLNSRGASITVQDVTELEDAQREHERLQRLAEVGQMTATIAHEIRNPLTGIRSAAKMIRENPELGDEFAEIIETESIKLSQLCDEFLEFARPLRLEFQPSQLAEPVELVAKTMASAFESAGIRLNLQIDENQPTLKLDLRRFEQVVRNLLLNALQATPRGGEVTVRVLPNCLQISDTGSGMDEATVGRLFSPFFTTKPQGTGLGLSMVRKVVDAHEATIEVASKPGEGSLFTIRFNQGGQS